MKKSFRTVAKLTCIFLVIWVLFVPWLPTYIQAKEIEETLSKAEITVGESLRLRILGYSWRTTWESSDENIVEVSSDGTITGISPGEATVTATMQTFGWNFTRGGKTQEFSITVSGNGTGENETEKSEKTQSEESEIIQLGTGESVTLDSPEKGKTVWKSSDTSIADVSDEGKVTGISPGDVKITATTKTGGFKFLFFHFGEKTRTEEYFISIYRR